MPRTAPPKCGSEPQAVPPTCLQQHPDAQVVVGQHGVVQGCAATEAGTDIQAVVELILAGHEDCKEEKTWVRELRGTSFHLQAAPRSLGPAVAAPWALRAAGMGIIHSNAFYSSLESLEVPEQMQLPRAWQVL